MALGRKGYLVVAVLLLALAVGAGAYYRYRVLKAVAECDTPALPQKPATPPPNLPGFEAGAACAPGEEPAKK